MKIISLLVLMIGCIKSEMKDASKQLHLNKTRFEEQIDIINSCLKKGGLSDHQIKTVDSKKILESTQKEIPESVCASYTSATLDHPTIRRCRYLLHPISTIEVCLNKAQQDNIEFRAEVVRQCQKIKLQLADLADEEKRNLESFPMYHWLKDRRCADENYDQVHNSAGSGEM